MLNSRTVFEMLYISSTHYLHSCVFTFDIHVRFFLDIMQGILYIRLMKFNPYINLKSQKKEVCTVR